jgi:MoaA/NifB/PqqE/SkfB family radical SAM enzyme
MLLTEIKSLFFEVTSHCNIKCPQCSRTNDRGELPDWLSLKHWDVDRILPNLQLDQLSGLKFVKIEGDNGDALMHPKLESILDKLYQAPSGPSILILTNGSMRSADWWYRLGQKYQGKLTIQFSIDGLDDTHHLYRVGADYQKVVDNARAFIRGGGEATQRCLIFRHNQHQLSAIKDRAQEIGFLQLIIKPGDLFRFNGQTEWPVYWQGKNTHTIYPTVIDYFQQYEYNLSNMNFPHHKEYNHSLLCTAWRKGRISITYQGHLIPCCIHQADLYFDHAKNDKFRTLLGDVNLFDINQYSLSEILSHPDYYDNRLEQMLRSTDRLPTCQQACGNNIDRLLKINRSQ